MTAPAGSKLAEQLPEVSIQTSAGGFGGFAANARVGFQNRLSAAATSAPAKQQPPSALMACAPLSIERLIVAESRDGAYPTDINVSSTICPESRAKSWERCGNGVDGLREGF
jgi:hypothetical protein